MILQDFYDGKAFDCYKFFGAHIVDGGVIFRTYAPAAKGAAVFGEFSDWETVSMTQDGKSGVYSVLIPTAKAGQMYKYRIYREDGGYTDHCDPYGFGMELRPNWASIIVDMDKFRFSDDEWLSKRDKNYNKPMSIYEVHLGSWMTDPTDENGWYKYEEIAPKLIKYVKSHGFTHIEFMPLSEHPADISWGYQNTGFFSPTSRYGTADGLKRLVNSCHVAGIGVIMDFVPVHFAIDSYGLADYDGTQLYEYPRSDVTVSEWGTCNFIYARREVCSFLQSAANYWLSEFHFDGLRMDAISRAIYWQGDPNRGVNEQAVDFLKNMNSGLHHMHPTAMLIAEDSTDYLKVTAPVEYGGLGFDYKWDLGWMNDTLNYFRTPPEERPKHYNKLTFSMAYFYNELYLLPFSHDENVHGKATVIQKMWGDYEDKFPQARALYMYMTAHTGKILNFMGGEFAQFREWDETREQDWLLLKYPLHDSFSKYFAKLMKIMSEHPALYAEDYNSAAFKWLEVNGAKDSVYIFMRKSGDDAVVAAFNFDSKPKAAYEFAVDNAVQLKEILNSDWQEYSGKTVKPKSAEVIKTKGIDGKNIAKVDLPAFSGRLFVMTEQKAAEPKKKK